MMCTERGPGGRPGCGGRQTPAAALGCLALIFGNGVPAAGAAQGGLAQAVRGGTPGVALRYRYEHVDQDGFVEDADASTLRLRLNYATGAFRGWSAFAEFDYVGELFVDDFNSGGGTSGPSRAGFPVVADPDGGDLNQLYFDYLGIADTTLRFGRQRILLDNQRYVGGVGWRQNEQTFDGVTLLYDGIAATQLHYSYVSRVNRIFGDRSDAGRNDNATHLVNARLAVADVLAATAYGYFIDNEDVPAFSTTTYGLRVNGSIEPGGQTLTLTAEAATQTDAASAPVDYRAGYLRFEAGWAPIPDLRLGVGYELLGGDSAAAGAAFRTPLATLHAFQGWADQFLSTPDAGVEDLFASLGYTRAGWTVQGVWHRFAADSGGARWGDELDLSARRSFGERYGLLLKAALFQADDAAFSDTTKVWLMLTAAY